MSEPFFEMLPVETQATFERIQPMELKNVSRAVPTYRFTVPVAGIADPAPMQPA